MNIQKHELHELGKSAISVIESVMSFSFNFMKVCWKVVFIAGLTLVMTGFLQKYLAGTAYAFTFTEHYAIAYFYGILLMFICACFGMLQLDKICQREKNNVDTHKYYVEELESQVRDLKLRLNDPSVMNGFDAYPKTEAGKTQLH